jgi:hypothetical protein
MTPLAAKLLNCSDGGSRLSPLIPDWAQKKKLTAGLTQEFIEQMHDTYVFDCTPLAKNDWWASFCTPPQDRAELHGPSMVRSGIYCTSLDELLVPAKKTWIEYICPTSGLLTALHTVKIPDADEFTANLFTERPQGVRHHFGIGRLCFEIGDRSNGAIGEWVQRPWALEKMEDQYDLNADGDLAAWVLCLQIINSSRSQHVPTTVPRKERRAAQSVMKRHNITFLGCSQVHLKEAEDPRRQQTVMTAEQASKCRHKVRAHNRNLSNGKTIRIPEHWRGDARKGVKDSTYIVSRDAA